MRTGPLPPVHKKARYFDMRDYYQLPPRELGKNAKLPVLLTGDSGEAFYELAREMASVIRDHNSRGEKTVFIVPVGSFKKSYRCTEVNQCEPEYRHQMQTG